MNELALAKMNVANRPPFYYVFNEWYKGGAPAFYHENEFPLTSILLENKEIIQEEIASFYKTNGRLLKQNFSPYNTDEKGWKTIVLDSYGILNKKHIKFFPKTWELVKNYPGLSLFMVAVLKPNTTLKAHFGDTDAIVRNHLGIIIPGELPNLGIRIKTEERSWTKDNVLSFCVVNRHKAWNHTNSDRVILMIDFVKPEYLNIKKEIWGKVLAAELMKWISNKILITKKLPKWTVLIIHSFLGKLIQIYTWLRRFYIKLS